MKKPYHSDVVRLFSLAWLPKQEEKPLCDTDIA